MNKIERTLSSIEVAEMVEKRHDNLLADIRGYEEELSLLKNQESNSQLKIEPSDFFVSSTYMNRGKEYPCYNVTKKGCEFIAHKLTGIKGTEFTAKYIHKFHDMEEQIQQPRTTMELLELEFAAIKEVDGKIDAVNEDLQQFKQDMPILGLEADKITTAVRRKGAWCLGGKKSNAYADRSLRSRLYSDIYRELYRQFGISTYKALKRSQCDVAIGIVDAYIPPLILVEEIDDCNTQMNLGMGVA